jgi:hypothetical protein
MDAHTRIPLPQNKAAVRPWSGLMIKGNITWRKIVGAGSRVLAGHSRSEIVEFSLHLFNLLECPNSTWTLVSKDICYCWIINLKDVFHTLSSNLNNDLKKNYTV